MKVKANTHIACMQTQQLFGSQKPRSQQDRPAVLYYEDYSKIPLPSGAKDEGVVNNKWGTFGSGLAVISPSGHEVLMLKRMRCLEHNNKWTYPGGAVPKIGNDYVDPLASAIKEFREEALNDTERNPRPDIRLPKGCLFSQPVDYVDEDGRHFYTYFLLLNEDCANIEINSEASDYGWFPIADLIAGSNDSEVELHPGAAWALSQKYIEILEREGIHLEDLAHGIRPKRSSWILNNPYIRGIHASKGAIDFELTHLDPEKENRFLRPTTIVLNKYINKSKVFLNRGHGLVFSHDTKYIAGGKKDIWSCRLKSFSPDQYNFTSVQERLRGVGYLYNSPTLARKKIAEIQERSIGTKYHSSKFQYLNICKKLDLLGDDGKPKQDALVKLQSADINKLLTHEERRTVSFVANKIKSSSDNGYRYFEKAAGFQISSALKSMTEEIAHNEQLLHATTDDIEGCFFSSINDLSNFRRDLDFLAEKLKRYPQIFFYSNVSGLHFVSYDDFKILESSRQDFRSLQELSPAFLVSIPLEELYPLESLSDSDNNIVARIIDDQKYRLADGGENLKGLYRIMSLGMSRSEAYSVIHGEYDAAVKLIETVARDLEFPDFSFATLKKSRFDLLYVLFYIEGIIPSLIDTIVDRLGLDLKASLQEAVIAEIEALQEDVIVKILCHSSNMRVLETSWKLLDGLNEKCSQDSMKKIALNALHLHTRMRATQRLTSQEILAQIVLNEKDDDASAHTLNRIKDPEILKDIVLMHRQDFFRHKSLFKVIDYGKEYYGKRLFAMQVLQEGKRSTAEERDELKAASSTIFKCELMDKTKEIVLKDIVLNTRHEDIRKIALEALQGSQSLVQIARNAPDHNIRKAAIETGFLEDKILLGIVLNDENFHVREAASREIKSDSVHQQIMLKLVENPNDPFERGGRHSASLFYRSFSSLSPSGLESFKKYALETNNEFFIAISHIRVRKKEKLKQG